jgi:CCR4-NOT complex subunit CAF16
LRTYRRETYAILVSSNAKTIGTEFSSNPHVRMDVLVSQLLKGGKEDYSERCKILMNVMDVDPDWRMHKVSDGQRRRVQIVMVSTLGYLYQGLLPVWDVLLLDEVTVDLVSVLSLIYRTCS